MKDKNELKQNQTSSWDFGGVGKTYVPGKYYGMGPKSYKRSDERILDDVCHLLTVDPDVDASEIDVKVTDGIVHLSGTVSSRQMKKLAEECLESVKGIREVDNDLRVHATVDTTSVPPT